MARAPPPEPLHFVFAGKLILDDVLNYSSVYFLSFRLSLPIIIISLFKIFVTVAQFIPFILVTINNSIIIICLFQQNFYFNLSYFYYYVIIYLIQKTD